LNTECFNIIDVFVRVALRHGAVVALKQDDSAVDYQSLLEQVQVTAGRFLEKGIKPGDKVLVFMLMSHDLYRLVLALFYIGASPVFLDEWTSIARLKECCGILPCSAVIAPGRLLWLAHFIGPLQRIPIKLSASFRKSARKETVPHPTLKNSTALVTFTTGSTGFPKAADRTHGYLLAQLKALTPLIPDDASRLLCSLPIVVLINLALGRTTILPPRKYRIKKEETAVFLDYVIQKEGVDTLIVSPAITRQLLPFPQPSVRHIITGGGPVFPDLAAQIASQFPGAAMTIVFGSTEAEPISHIRSEQLIALADAPSEAYGLPVGMPDKHARIAILPFMHHSRSNLSIREWQELLCNSNTAGEIVVSGAHVLEHYLNNPAAEALHKIRVEGTVWHRTDDAGMLGKDGMLYFLGRCQEVISHGNHLLFPVMVSYRFTMMTGRNAALLKISGQLLLAVEATCPLEKEGLHRALFACGIGEAKVVYLRKLPRDPRHQTKIDYEQLYTLLAKYTT
jgi:acyl-CoA synthetase (AMP-forming)/AMP-acid ligase II